MRNHLTRTATISTTNQEMYMAILNFETENWHLVRDSDNEDKEKSMLDINQELDVLLTDRNASFFTDSSISYTN
jgi:hypothetical protein